MQDSEHAPSAEELTRDPVALIHSPKSQIAPLLRKSLYQIDGGAYDEAVTTAAQLGTVARNSGDRLAVLTADRLAAQAYHFKGDHASARVYAERVMDHPAKAIPVAYVPVQTDRRMWMRIVLARSLWMQGRPEQASGMIAEALELARSDSPFALCQALALGAGPIAFWNGVLAEARRHVELLISEANRHKLSHWKMYGEWFARALEPDIVIDNTHDDLRSTARCPSSNPISGLLRDTIITINPWITTVDLLGLPAVGWCAAELVRVKGESHVRGAKVGFEVPAERLFLESLKVAEGQRALGWELRSSLSLSLLWTNQGKKEQARQLLDRVCTRFSEGFHTNDLTRALTHLESLG